MTTDSDRLDLDQCKLIQLRLQKNDGWESHENELLCKALSSLIARVEELEGETGRLRKEQHELLEDYKDYRLKHDDYYSLGGE